MRKKAGVQSGGRKVVLHDIESEVVEAAEAPDSDYEEGCGAEAWVIEEQEGGGKEASGQEGCGFKLDEGWACQVANSGLLSQWEMQEFDGACRETAS